MKLLRVRLVSYWREFWRLWSIRLNAAGLAVLGLVQFNPMAALGVWNMMPAAVRAILPPDFLSLVGMLLFLLSGLAVIVRQPKLEARIHEQSHKSA